MFDEGVRLQWQMVSRDGHSQHPGVKGRGNFLEQPVGRQVRPCQEPIGPWIHGRDLASLGQGTPPVWRRTRGNRAMAPFASPPIGFVPPCRKGGGGPMGLLDGARGQPSLTVPRPAHVVWAMMGRQLLQGPPRVGGPNAAGLTWPDT